jgi:hypothetical protein
MIFICVRVTCFQFLGSRSETFPKFIPCVRYPSNGDMRIYALWQFYIYITDITRIFRFCITITNIQKFSLLKIVDFVPRYVIRFMYFVFGYQNVTCNFGKLQRCS